MRWIRIILLILIATYSVTLIWIDVQWGQDQVRGFFSDIVTGTDYPLPCRAFFGINTTLTVSMLAGIVIVFSASAGCSGRYGANWKTLLFQHSQVAFFLYIAADERLLIHEKMGSLLGVEDAFLILGLGLVEVVLLVFAGEMLKQALSIKGWLLGAGVFFSIMIVADAFLPDRMPGRLAIEDLSKTWAIFCLLVFAWQYHMDWIARCGKGGQDGN